MSQGGEGPTCPRPWKCPEAASASLGAASESCCRPAKMQYHLDFIRHTRLPV